MKTYKHYGVNVTLQDATDKNIEKELNNKNIPFVKLNDDLILYKVDGIYKYMYITSSSWISDADIQNVFITEKIPMDGNWNKLALDVLKQSEGGEPEDFDRYFEYLTNEETKKFDGRNPFDVLMELVEENE